MSILILAIEKPYWQDVLINLERDGVKISAAVVHYRYPKSPNRFFKDFKGVQVDGKLFYRNRDVSALIRKDFGKDFPPLDEQVIRGMEQVERDYYILTDRFCYFPRSFRYRKRLFRDSIRYWLAFFEKHKIKAVFASCTPHNLSDYTAFHTAKYLGIPVVMCAHSMINDHVIIRHDYRGEDKVPENFLAGKTYDEVRGLIPETLAKSAYAESQVLKLVIQKNDSAQKIKNLNASVSGRHSRRKRIRLTAYKIYRRLSRLLFSTPKFKGALALNGTYPPTFRRILRVFERNWQRRQRSFHDNLAITPDLSQKYVYFAMHLQPERTSTPEAEVFEDHLIAIEILARSLPEGWKLYVKENPRQFDRKINILKGRHMRDKTDYADIARLPNTFIIRQDVPTKELIASAQVVSTLSGSIGWESLQAGKPCIVFANAWYSECRSVFRVRDVASAKAAITAAREKKPEGIKLDIAKYLVYMKDKYQIGIMGDEVYIKAAKTPYETLVDEMSARLAKEIRAITGGRGGKKKSKVI